MRILSRHDVLELLTLRDCIAAVEDAFRLHAAGRTLGPGVLAVPAEGGGFHIKAAELVGERSYFAAKTNANSRTMRAGTAFRPSRGRSSSPMRAQVSCSWSWTPAA